jgi:hypothetical protein
MSIDVTANKVHTPRGLLAGEELILESRLCHTIINRTNGREYKRDLDPRARWFQVYEQAVLNPDKFVIEMDEAPKTVIRMEGDKGMENRPLYATHELEGLSMPRLLEIGRQWGVKDVRKQSLVLKIIEAQTAMVVRANLDDLPKKG